MNVIDLLSLKDQVAIVTGGAGHLGKAMTEALYEAGARVYVIARNKVTFDECKFDKDKVFFIKGDIMSKDSLNNCFQKVFDENNRIDILINNAFHLAGEGLPEQISDEDWAETSEGVLGSVFRAIREVIPFMEKNNYGKIINIGSMYGVVSPNLSMYDIPCQDNLNPLHYGTLKAGVIQMTKYLGAYLIEKNINVNAISPGTYPSPNVQKDEVFVKRLKTKNPANRIGQPDDLKGVTLLLASHASDYIVGQNLIVDGGWTIW